MRSCSYIRNGTTAPRVRRALTALLIGIALATPALAENFDVMVAPLVPYKRYGAPTMVELKDGRILIAYNNWTELGLLRDFSPANITARISDDGGRTWGRPFILEENTSVVGRMGPPSLLRLQNGDIGFFYSELNGYDDYSWYFESSSDEAKTWSGRVQISKEKAYYVMNNHRVIQLTSGRLLAPISYVPDVSKRSQFSWEGFCYYSDDNGRTWGRSKGQIRMPKYPVGVQEPGLIELKDGSVMMIIRNAQQRVYKSISRDRGETWSEPRPIEELIAPVSPATIMRIPSTGDLAIVWNYSPKVRTPLAIAISQDEGNTWGKIKFLETDYYSYAYIAFLFPSNSDQLLLCYWVGARVGPRAIALKVRGLDIDWLYESD